MDVAVESECEGGLVIDEREEGEIPDDEKEEKEKERGAGSAMTLRPIGTTQSESKTVVCPMPGPSTSSSTSSFPLSSSSTGKGRMQWNMDEMMNFYDGVKQFGKDFDGLHKYLSRRKIERDKEQLRNFYFNFFKLVKVAADVKEEDWSADIPRDARDLFIVINGCEWKKRTDNCKYEQAKLKSLIMEGVTVTRVVRKKQHVTIKTPCCPALLQFFSFNRRISRFPPDVILYLGPKTFSDGTNVMSRGQNKDVCIRVSTSDRVERIFDMLVMKWRGGERGARPFQLRLFPSKHTLMGEILFTPSPSSFASLSINMLREDRLKTENVKQQIKKGQIEETACYHASQSLIDHLTINRDILKRGLTKELAGDASVAELFAVCGLHRELSLVYSIEEEEDKEANEPWTVLINLLGRGYGEAIVEKRTQQGAKTPNRGNSSTTEKETLEPMRKRSRIFKRPDPPCTSSVLIPESSIVAEEFDEFTEQLRSMTSPPRAKRRSPIRNKNFFVRPMKTEIGSLCSTPVPLSSTRHTPSHSTHSIHPSTTPSRSGPSTTFPHMNAVGDDPMAQALRAALISPGNSLLEAPSTSMRTTGRAVMENSPLKATNSSLPFDVRLSMEQMMNQNSIDFCLNFNQLINHTDLTDSPSKL